MTKATIRQKLIAEHMPDCLALEQVRLGRWSIPWSECVTAEFRDAKGNVRKRGGRTTIWLIARCNSMPCPARIMMHGEDVFIAAQANGARP